MASLLSAASGLDGADANARTQAQAILENAEKTNHAQYIQALVSLMAQPTAAEHLRNLAGLQIKNALTGTSLAIIQEKKLRWLALDPNLRVAVKSALLALLCDRSTQVARSAAIVVAKMGELELSEDQWPELCTQLHDNVTNSNAQAQGDAAHAAQIRRFTLNAMGYLCEYLYDADVNLDAAPTSKLLTAIIFCMDDQQPADIRHAAMQALSESLPFATTNFGNSNERNVIMKKICEASQMQGQDEDSIKTRRYVFLLIYIYIYIYCFFFFPELCVLFFVVVVIA